ncbi:response regulator [Flaviaesturariibacter flavus]|uniref:Response regulator n=1 Tax=Flaviaesturariibacter flavus TaxID=2502780 RepID=A0A4R1BBX9_9BACT|nr:response regulator [Flaviaesturariibacter flavus]TCJ14526.1 response regulator [Flaviaesturariibacter flavus]
MEKVINILLVEDDELDVIDIRRTLDKMNIVYHLEHARNGEDALRLLEGSVPDVALVDINMPKMNGIEFLQSVRSHPEWKGLKCFIITTSDEKVDRVAASELGVSGYIVKPLKINNPSSMDAFNLMIDLMNMR